MLELAYQGRAVQMRHGEDAPDGEQRSGGVLGLAELEGAWYPAATTCGRAAWFQTPYRQAKNRTGAPVRWLSSRAGSTSWVRQSVPEYPVTG